MNIEIIKSHRKTIAIEIKPDLRVIVRAPFFMTNKTINNFITEKSDWINRNISVMKRKAEERSKLPALTPIEI